MHHTLPAHLAHGQQLAARRYAAHTRLAFTASQVVPQGRFGLPAEALPHILRQDAAEALPHILRQDASHHVRHDGDPV